MSEKIRLLLADDQQLVRSALAALLELDGAFRGGRAKWAAATEVVAAALGSIRPTWRCSTSKCRASTGWLRPPALAQEVPQCRVIILTTFGRPGYLRRAMESGALGFVVKDAPAEQLADAGASRGRRRAGRRSGARRPPPLAGGASPLTGRERDVLVAARSGATVADIAGKLFLSEGTVRNYSVRRHSQDGRVPIA